MTTAVKSPREDTPPHPSLPPELRFQQPTADTLSVELAGNWTLAADIPDIGGVAQQLQAAPQVRRLTFETQKLQGWDSTVLPFLLKCQALCSQGQITCDFSTLPPGIQGLLRLATAVPERSGARREAVKEPFLVRIGKTAQENLVAAKDLLTFLGEVTVALARLLRGKARFRRADFLLVVQECGAQALPIVSLISFLVGLILAFVGAVQLRLRFVS